MKSEKRKMSFRQSLKVRREISIINYELPITNYE